MATCEWGDNSDPASAGVDQAALSHRCRGRSRRGRKKRQRAAVGCADVAAKVDGVDAEQPHGCADEILNDGPSPDFGMETSVGLEAVCCDQVAALALAELECEDHDEETEAIKEAKVAEDCKGSMIGGDLRHDLAAIDAMKWATDVLGGRSFAYFQTMAARAQLVMQLAELEAEPA